MTERKKLLKVLRVMGFRRTYRHSWLVIYESQIGNRCVEVQIWNDGMMRASHAINGRETTLPTKFKTIEEMIVAIKHERTRMDNGVFDALG